ncbi:HxlR family transcriptional regulator [Paenibacillus sp. TCA20]|nr:HxlR family transcriptional regulator [Paenibacillus sp. TCA20]
MRYKVMLIVWDIADSTKVEYSLSDHGKTLSSVLNDMCKWGFTHIEFTKQPEND